MALAGRSRKESTCLTEVRLRFYPSLFRELPETANRTSIGQVFSMPQSLFDRVLSLQIDAIHDELDRIGERRGPRAWLRRFLLRRRLRRLERRVPR